MNVMQLYRAPSLWAIVTLCYALRGCFGAVPLACSGIKASQIYIWTPGQRNAQTTLQNFPLPHEPKYSHYE